MLINIKQNKKNSGKKISYNKGNKMIIKYNSNKIQDFYPKYYNIKKYVLSIPSNSTSILDNFPLYCFTEIFSNSNHIIN